MFGGNYYGSPYFAQSYSGRVSFITIIVSEAQIFYAQYRHYDIRDIPERFYFIIAKWRDYFHRI